MNLAIVNDVLPPGVIQELRRWVKDDEIPLTRCNLNSWDQAVVKFSGSILIRDIRAERKVILMEALREFLPAGIEPVRVNMTHNLFGRLAYIPWHNDDKHALSMTIYLNERWDRDWAGYLILEEGDGLQAYVPKFNSAVIFEPPVMHTVALPSLEAPLRETLQVFVSKEAAP